ncbi:FtsK/SpoIIIE domain-containing protein [Roseibium suaedae]|uniref:DNA segregation ATPase FtsK/SpoIIIE, S-DNA-T family n=1 Tax=Roseibium suaedae TaxID=735517 RepID=A0A1M7L5Y1_9HYPH|nr:FtsK/SpoIIIE domain-containing protein [Roseibium suaedae]SHM73352.1 DNA segregation ATPase FtsK/SpoIIIE, S-DNA-T family [Roseibium suaedae]
MTAATRPDYDLIGQVAAKVIERAIKDDPTKKPLFAIVGLEPGLTSAIVRKVHSTIPGVEAYVNPELSDDSLPSSMLSSESATHFRNMEKSEGEGAILIATSTDHLEVVGATVKDIKKISEQSLLREEDIWIDCCHELRTLNERGRENLRRFMIASYEAGLVINGLPMFAAFMLALDKSFESTPNLSKCMDDALPYFRIPAGAGHFKVPSSNDRPKSVAKWRTELAEIQTRAENAIYLRNDRGSPLDLKELSLRVEELFSEGRISSDDANKLKALVEDGAVHAGDWTAAQEEAVKLPWDVFVLLLKQSKAPKKAPLGAATLDWFDTNEPSSLSDDEKELLTSIASERDDADDQERELFFRLRESLKSDKRLLKRWESFVFRKIEEHDNLLSGILIAAADLKKSIEDLPDDPIFLIKMVGAEKLSFWKEKNTDLCRYLRDNWRSLPGLVSDVAVLDFGLLWSHSDHWDDGKTSEKTSQISRQFKFDIFVVDRSDTTTEEDRKNAIKTAKHSTQLVWTMPPNSFANAYSANVRDIANFDSDAAILALGRFSRSQASDRPGNGVISLDDRSSVQDAFDKREGALVEVNDTNLNMGQVFRAALTELRGDILIAESAAEIESSFNAFEKSYTSAVRGFADGTGAGLLNDDIYEQSRRYGELLQNLRRLARNDVCRERLWQPALSIGLAWSTDAPPAAISCPWHPFRLAEHCAKAERAAEALRALLKSGDNGADLRTFAISEARSIERSWHPNLSLTPLTSKPRLLVETSHFAGFGYMEPPTVDEGANESFDSYAKEATSELLTVAKEYLDIHPHERANFSAVLYNADNRELPAKLADQLARKVEHEADLRCDLILTHTNPERLREIYADQNNRISMELDGVLASEAAQTFLSRLRVGFVDVDSVDNGSGTHKADVALLHDVISRSALVSWRKIHQPRRGWPSFHSHLPDEQTRRQSHAKGERKSEMLLIPSTRPVEVQAYVNLIHDLHRDDKNDTLENYAPVREINFADSSVGDAIRKAHNVAEWVVTYDEIADRQLLKNNDINVIRFITRPGASHNLIVSTNKTGGILHSRIQDKLIDLTPKRGQDLSRLADEFIKAAARISGRVVLQAARSEKNAHELIGLVLSDFAIRASLPNDLTPVACLLLDDFSDWLGHSGKKADLMYLCIGEKDDEPFVELVIVESKFVGKANQAQEMKSSWEQTRSTTGDLKSRLILDSDKLNRRMWRSRVADLLLEHGVFPQSPDGATPDIWTDMLRSNDADVRLRAASMVFIHDTTDDELDPYIPKEGEAEMRQFAFNQHRIETMIREFEGSEERKTSFLQLPHPAGSKLLPDPSPPADEPHEAPTEPVVDMRTPDEGIPADPGDTAPPTSETEEPVKETEEAVDRSFPPKDTDGGSYPMSVMEYMYAQPASVDTEADNQWLETTQVSLRRALKGYGMETEIVDARLTPISGMISFKGNDNLTVQQVTKKKEELQTSHGIVVTDVRPGVGEVLVMVRRPNRRVLSLTELWKRRELPETAPVYNGSFLIGEREENGELVYLNLYGENGGQPQHGPHTLIAGESNSGKGVLTRNLILDILATNSPRNLRLKFIDPKFGGDYRWLRGMPHMDGDIITSPDLAIAAFRELVDEMERRYEEIMKIASNIDKYNAKVAPEARLPRIVLVHDELGDWTADKENTEYQEAVSNQVVRLAQKARAAGVHLIVITQRPDKDALPSQVKANLNNKICLKVSSGINSRIVLDETGAENLIGRGHFAAKLANEIPTGNSGLIIGQAPFIDEDDADDLAEAIKKHWGRA